MISISDFSVALLVILNLINIGLLIFMRESKKKLVRGLSEIIHDFERDKSVLLQIEAVNPDHVYLRNPRR